MADKPTIIVDTREQEAYSFSAQRFVTERRALPAGDYSLAGLEREVTIERKSFDDFIHTVIRDRDRFKNELKLLQNYPCACVVVEADLADVFTGDYRSGAHPNSVFGATMSIIVDYGVPVYFCSNRQIACRFVMEFLLRYHQRGIDSCNARSQTHIPFSEEKSNESSSPPPTSVRGGF
jgi:DNA excision repair protein ERCC-4